MNNEKFCTRPATKYAQFLCRIMKEQKIANPNELAIVTGMNQPTIQRILTGQIKQPSSKTLQPLLKHFGYTYAQAMGEAFYVERNPDEQISAKARDLAKKWDALPSKSQQCIATLIQIMSPSNVKNREKIEE